MERKARAFMVKGRGCLGLCENLVKGRYMFTKSE